MSSIPSSVLITGAAGFLGSHVADHCLKNGMRVVAVDDLSGGFLENIPKGAEFKKGSITDAGFLSNLFNNNKFDTIYHLAAYAAEGLSHFIRHFNYEVNLQGSILLINEAVKHNVGCFVFTSSIAVYGPGQTPMGESLVPHPEDPYGISKYAVELDLEAAYRMFGLKYIIFRPHNVYGERQNIADRYRNVIGIFMNQVMQGQPMTVFGDGLQTRAFSHVEDVAPIIARAPLVATASNETFNIGADMPHTVLELAKEVAASFGVETRVKHLDPRKEVVHAFASHEKLKGVFMPTELVTLSDGIRRMAKWAKEHGPMKEVTFNNIELTKNLPTSWKPA